MNTSVPEPYALQPLTVFDKLFESTTFVTGWLLEGIIDAVALASALDAVTGKWRMLAGRLQSVKEGENVKWMIKIPLGPIPTGYRTYSLTTSTSPLPLSNYVSVPLPSVSTSVPPSVFLHDSTPRQYIDWESKSHPLTCWNVVHFPASVNNGVDYTCIGFARSHGVFDGGGAALVMNALVAEMHGRQWSPPPLPVEGMNVNPVEEALAHEARRSAITDHDTEAYTPIGRVGATKLIAWHTREKWWRSADRRIVLMPKAVLSELVETTRTALRMEGRQVDHVTTGDILVAWIFKTSYSTLTSLDMKIHCTNLANFRGLIENASAFPHNAFTPLPYPVLSVADVQAFSLPALTSLFAASRLSLSIDHVVAAYKILHKKCFPNPPSAQETMMVSNVSASRILESDWSAIGSKRTICGYRYQATPTDLLFTNAVYIAGRLSDGSVVLDVTLNKERVDLVAGEIQRMTARIKRNELYSQKRP